MQPRTLLMLAILVAIALALLLMWAGARIVIAD
jgi:hypothetical protein